MIEEILHALHTEGGVEVMKASAGSGKTFSLAREYIRLLLSMRGTPLAHRHILAVTFTNKATGEMKNRIIEELDTLATDPGESNYLEYLLKECPFDSHDSLKEAAGKALSDILSDYGGFSVSTIDRFFQQALRAFAREAGQLSEYQIELDRDALISESVERVLDSLGEGDKVSKGLLKWLSDSSIDYLESGDGYHLEKSLGDFAKGFMHDTFEAKEKSLGIDRTAAFSEDNLKAIIARCREVCSSFDTDFKKAVGDASTIISSYDGVTSYLSKHIAKLSAYRPGDKIEFADKEYWTNTLDDGSAAFKKAVQKRLGQADFDRVRDAVRGIEAFRGQRYRERRTAELLRRQVSLFRVADALDARFKELLAEKNVLSLDDTNSILRDLIDGTDAPFIYEKLGVKYRHFLLDEFQDTSAVQWDNFRPLLRESIASGWYNLIVGDVKQSIYRWRDADWGILDSRVSAELERTVDNPLKANWRSAEKIVKFNNAFFEELARRMDAALLKKTGVEGDGKIAAIFKDVEQDAAKSLDVEGSVEMSFCSTRDIYPYVVEAVKAAREERGFAYKDIAVIVRTNSIGGEVASRLVAAGIPVISNDSLKIASGRTVRTLVARLFALDDPDDAINTFEAGEFDPSCTRGCQSLSETVQALLAQMDPDQVSGDTLYVLAFLDLLRDFVQRHGNSLHAFLDYWQSEGTGRSLSSPEGADAVTIITIHKAKGLDYPFVVLPVPGMPFVSRRAHSWECPDLEGTPFDGVQKALYDVKTNKDLSDSLFRRNYFEELQRIYIDNVNMWYVAMTRAVEALHIVSEAPSGDVRSYNGEDKWPDFSGMTGPLFLFASHSGMFNPVPAEAPERESESEDEDDETPQAESFVYGTLSPKAPSREKKSKRAAGTLALDYSACTFNAKGRLKLKSDSKEFFEAEEGSVSRRVRGTVLHAILERVTGPSDLHAAVEGAVMDGMLDSSDAAATESMLSDAIEKVLERGWFPSDASLVFNERDIVGPGHYNHTKRPDRVVKTSRGIDVVDYKFGAPRRSYIDQVRLYAAMYRDLGWEKVTPYIWYVESGEVVDAS